MKHDESKIQISCVLWWRMQYGRKYPFGLFAIPNGAMLSGDEKSQPIKNEKLKKKADAQARAMKGARLKKEGLEAGVSDLFLSIPSGDLCGLWLECKTKTGPQQDSQKKFEVAVLSRGYGYAIFRSSDEFQQIVKSYLADGTY